MTTEVQQDGTTPTMNELIEANILAIVDARHVSFPATVLVYNPTTQLCNVQPAVRIFETIEGVDVPLLIPPCLDCPVLFPTGGGYTMQWPLNPGDDVEVIVQSHDMDAWLTAGTPDTIPTSRRRGDLSDAAVWPGMRPKTNPRLATGPGGMSMGLDTMASEVRVQPTEVVVTAPTLVKLGSVAASRPAAFGDSVDSYFTLQHAWMVAVEAILAGLGVPVGVPITPPPTTSTLKTRVE
jgi:hypothetical protein